MTRAQARLLWRWVGRPTVTAAAAAAVLAAWAAASVWLYQAHSAPRPTRTPYGIFGATYATPQPPSDLSRYLAMAWTAGVVFVGAAALLLLAAAAWSAAPIAARWAASRWRSARNQWHQAGQQP